MQITGNEHGMPEYLRDAYVRSQQMTEQELHDDSLRILNEMRARIGAKPLEDFLPVDEHGNIIPEQPAPKPPLGRRIRQAWRVLQGK